MDDNTWWHVGQNLRVKLMMQSRIATNFVASPYPKSKSWGLGCVSLGRTHNICPHLRRRNQKVVVVEVVDAVVADAVVVQVEEDPRNEAVTAAASAMCNAASPRRLQAAPMRHQIRNNKENHSGRAMLRTRVGAVVPLQTTLHNRPPWR
jgi:hypothetical protein